MLLIVNSIQLLSMLSTPLQQKIIGALLKRSENNYCSDCNGKSPCWASLDFGVFVCMNCSGAHRALGPSITRVKSTRLDTWHKDWVQNMKIGNSIINKYWENQLENSPINTKPNVNSSLNQIKKYVFDKYLKRKYVDQSQQFDPLTRLKKGLFEEESSQTIQIPQKDNQPATIKQPKVQTPNIQAPQTAKKQLHLSNKNCLSNPKPTNEQVNLISFHDNPFQKNNQVIKGNHELKQNPISFDMFLDNISNKSVSSTKGNQSNQPQPVHGNYFMTPNGFVNNNGYHHDPHHGFSLPSHYPTENLNQQLHNMHHHNPGFIYPSHNTNPQTNNQVPQTTQVTMNISMNMYPNVMNINMGNCPSSNAPSQISVQPLSQDIPQMNNATVISQKQFGYNGFFTGNIDPPPQHKGNFNVGNLSQNQLNLDIRVKQKDTKNKDQAKSWLQDWM